MSNDIHTNLSAIISVALSYAKKHGVNYNIILMNPDEKGEFTEGSTYEYVTDSYFEKPRPFAKLLHKTDDLLKADQEQIEKDLQALDMRDRYKKILYSMGQHSSSTLRTDTITMEADKDDAFRKFKEAYPEVRLKGDADESINIPPKPNRAARRALLNKKRK